jgi:hypothetical protein
VNVEKAVTALKGMTAPELRAKYAEVFGEETKTRHKGYLLRRIAWRLQANAWGGLSERARQRALELAKDSDVRITEPRRSPEGGVRSPEEDGRTRRAPPDYGLKTPAYWDDRLPMPGTILAREYKGQVVRLRSPRVFEVRVLPKGFEYQGEIFRTLSAVAKVITGMHWIHKGEHRLPLPLSACDNGSDQEMSRRMHGQESGEEQVGR